MSLAACSGAQWCCNCDAVREAESLWGTWRCQAPCSMMLHGVFCCSCSAIRHLRRSFSTPGSCLPCAHHCQCCVLCFVQAMMEAGKLIVEHLVVQGLVAAFALPMTLLGASDIIDAQ